MPWDLGCEAFRWRWGGGGPQGGQEGGGEGEELRWRRAWRWRDPWKGPSCPARGPSPAPWAS